MKPFEADVLNDGRQIRTIRKRNLEFKVARNYSQLHFVGHRLGAFFQDIEVFTFLESSDRIVKKRKRFETFEVDKQIVQKKRKLE